MVKTYYSMHNHSMYSFQDGYATPKEYLDRASRLGLQGFAITEHGNQCSWVYFDELKKQYPDLKMTYGVEFYECDDINVKDKNNRYYHLVVIAKDEEGRKIINRLQRLSNDNFFFKPRVDLSMFKNEDCSHLIVSSACLASKLSKHKDDKELYMAHIEEYKSVFPNFYLEMQSHYHIDQERYNQFILHLSEITNTPYVITTDSHYAIKEDSQYHAMHIRASKDKDLASEIYEGCYLQSVEEIHECMDNQIGSDNVEKGLQETLNVLDLIDEVSMPWQDAKLPPFEVPSEFKNEKEYIRHLVQDIGWYDRNIHLKSQEEQKIYQERIDYELKVIDDMGFNGYFLIVWDFINWGRTTNTVEIGNCRGSSAGSLVNYLLQITGLDPIKYDLIFERFLNPERVTFPDIDCDINDRDKVIEYFNNKYGTDKVAKVCNFTFRTPLVAVRDVLKEYSVSYSLSKKISKSFDQETWKACEENLGATFFEKYAEYTEAFEVAKHLSGRVRQLSSHAGGVVIAQTTLDDYIGTSRDEVGASIINLDKKKCQPLGLVKHDILGLGNLNIIQEVKKDVGLTDFDLSPENDKFLYDQATFDLICSGNTNAVFQIESSGMKALVKQCLPRSLSEIADISALFRPDSMSMQGEYINSKSGKTAITYWHEDIKDILEPTYGALIYQEQTMAIVRKLGGRTMGGADKFRKYISSKDAGKIKEECEILKTEIVENGYTEELALTITDHLATMGGYSFNKSHAVGYSVITMQTAYLKAHYPLYFFKALLNENQNDYPKLNKYILDATDFGVEVVAPNINYSQRKFSVANNKVLFGLEAIKGLGIKVVDSILEERELNGNFKNILDLLERVPMGIKTVVSLVKSGAIPCNSKRKFLLTYAKQLYTKSEFKPVTTFSGGLAHNTELYGVDFKSMTKEERITKLNEFKKIAFDLKQEETFQKSIYEFRDKYLDNEKYWEFETLSVFLSDNPFIESLDFITGGRIEDIEDGQDGVVCGIISKISKKTDKRGNNFAFISLYSLDGIFDFACWSNQYKEYKDLIAKGNKVTILYTKREETLSIQRMKPYQEWLEEKRAECEERNNR